MSEILAELRAWGALTRGRFAVYSEMVREMVDMEPGMVAPLFVLYDYTFLPQGAGTKAEGLAIARENARRLRRSSAALKHSRRAVS